MKLGGPDRPPLDGGRERDPVLAPRDALIAVGDHWIVGMDEVEVRVLGDALEQAQPSSVTDLIPAHVRDLASPRKAADHPGDDVEPTSLAELLARREQE